MRYCILFILSVFVSVSCNRNSVDYTTKNYVYFRLDLNTQQARALLSPAGIIIVKDVNRIGEYIGQNGVAVVRSIDKTGEYYAFDLSCPYDYPDNVSLNIGDADLYCPKCGSRFQVIYGNGSPTKGPASKPLFRYKVTKHGNVLVVSV